jgi:endonuclease/exonuclease/phosphatase family metal-dependent hydrolase
MSDRLLTAVSCLVAVTGCGDDITPRHLELGVVTFNAGLAPGYVDLAAERAPAVGPFLAEIDADVMCLQEVWLDQDGDAVAEAVAGRFTVHRELTVDETATDEPACEQEESGPLADCFTAHCGEVGPEEVADCALEFCSSQFDAVGDTCQDCLVAHLGEPWTDILNSCVNGGGSFTYRGRNGLALLTRDPGWSVSYLAFPATQIARGALMARRTDPDLGELTVACTHLATDVGIDYTGEYGSWAGENLAQAEMLIDALPSGPVILLGDLNSGPAIGPNVEAELPAAYDAFEAAGLESAFIAAGQPACTFCDDNTLVDGEGAGGSLIDHVFVRGVELGAVERIATASLAIEVDGAPVTSNLSDHYGLRAETVW